MTITRSQRAVARLFAGFILLLLAVAAGVLLREYLSLRRIQATLRQSVEPNAAQTQPTAAPGPGYGDRFLTAVARSADGGLVRANANFAAFRRTVESKPELLQQWGRLGWKIVGDLPALCVRKLAGQAPFRVLGVREGDCITHIDGESINQPVRNMGIWLTLSARSRLKIDTLRGAKRISYDLMRQ